MIESYLYLPEIIQDLKEAVDRHPENPDLWLSLGDAYIRSNQVQNALNAYRQAEKLLL
jgi:cytochrome c-type biogenesis protein CcmH/NrfG